MKFKALEVIYKSISWTCGRKKDNSFLRNFLFKGCRPEIKSIDKRFRKQIKVLERSITLL